MDAAEQGRIDALVRQMRAADALAVVDADGLEWRAIPGHEGAYQISSLGNVRSLDRLVTMPRSDSSSHRKSAASYQRRFKGRSVATRLQGGYMTVLLPCLNGGNPKRVLIRKLLRDVFGEPARTVNARTG